MASNNLQNIYARDELNEAMINDTTYKSAVIDSGLIEEDGDLASVVAMGHGRKVTNVGWNDISDPLSTGNAAQATTHNPGYTDDSATDLIMNANSTYEYDTVKCLPAYGMGQKEIVKACSFVADPVTALNGKVSGYWARFFDKYAVSMLNGVYADNKANDSSDMIAGDGTAAISAELIMDGVATLGDAAEFGTGTLIINSAAMQVLRKEQLIDFIPSAENSAVMIPYFQGIRVIVSDQGFSDTTCVSVYAAPGAMVIGRSTQNIIPSETWRNPLSGVGGGEEMLITRQQFAMGVKGYSWQDATVTGSVSSGSIPGLAAGTKLWPAIADQALAANWDRVVDRKNVKIAFIHSSETPNT